MKILNKKKYINSFKIRNLIIEYYSYDLIFNDLINLFNKNKKIFIRSNN